MLFHKVKGFNSGGWNSYENTIRQFAIEKCATHPADFYGIAGVTLLAQHEVDAINPVNIQSTSDYLKRRIRSPRAMWSAYCCVAADGFIVGSSAFVGNNVQDKTRKRNELAQLSITDFFQPQQPSICFQQYQITAKTVCRPRQERKLN